MAAMRRLVVLLLLIAGCAFEGVEPPSTQPSSICAVFGAPQETGMLLEDGLTEVSGIAASSTNPGVLWVHNDSGSGPVVWAIDPAGRKLARVDVDGSDALDWEDIALADGRLYVADIGDNEAVRPDVTIYRFVEPEVTDGEVQADVLTVIYPGEPADAEAFLVDPISGDGFIITKRILGPGCILRVPAAGWEAGAVIAEPVGEIGIGTFALAGGPVTGGDITAAGSVIALRTYADVWIWERPEGSDVGEVLQGSPCAAPSPGDGLVEAIGFDGDGGYWTIAEGEGAPVWWVPRG